MNTRASKFEDVCDALRIGDGTPAQIAQRSKASLSATKRHLSQLHNEGLAHVTRWEIGSSPARVWSFGPGEDAPKPIPTAEEIQTRQAKRSEYLRQYALENKDRFAKNLAKYRNANREKVNESNRRSRERHQERARATWIAYYEANKEKCKAATKKWRLENRDAYRVMRQNRRARQRDGKLSKDIVARLYKLQRGKCACCSLRLGKDFHIDHINPLAKGGRNADDNVQLLRRLCNQKKNAKDPIDYMQEKGFLL
jgi:hypothetical protein